MQTRPLSAFGDQQNSHKRSCVIDVQHTEVMTWEAPHSDPVECVVLKDGMYEAYCIRQPTIVLSLTEHGVHAVLY